MGFKEHWQLVTFPAVLTSLSEDSPIRDHKAWTRWSPERPNKDLLQALRSRTTFAQASKSIRLATCHSPDQLQAIEQRGGQISKINPSYPWSLASPAFAFVFPDLLQAVNQKFRQQSLAMLRFHERCTKLRPATAPLPLRQHTSLFRKKEPAPLASRSDHIISLQRNNLSASSREPASRPSSAQCCEPKS